MARLRQRRLIVLATLVSVPVALPAGALAAPQAGTLQGTYHFQGTLSSTFRLTFGGAISIGDVQDVSDQESDTGVDWPVPLPTARTLDGFKQSVDGFQFSFSVPPDSFRDESIDGNSVRVFHWDRPPANTVITVVEQFGVTNQVDLAPFQSGAPYPVGQVPADVTPYLKTTSHTQLPADAAALASRLVQEKTSERAAIQAIAGWVAANIHYAATTANDAATVWATHNALCEGYDNLMLGMLRQLGVPARVEVGWVSSRAMIFPAPKHRRVKVNWGSSGEPGEAHTWLDVFFPGAGWVPIDPQLELFFVDPQHIALFVTTDATDFASASNTEWLDVSLDDGVDLGPPLPSGNQADFPGDGFGSVSDTETTTKRLRLTSVEQDPQGALLLAR